MKLEKAVLIIQKHIRGYLARKKLSLKSTALGKNIVSTTLKMKSPSMLFGPAASALDLGKTHEVMVTRIALTARGSGYSVETEDEGEKAPEDGVSIVLATNQGTPDSFLSYLKDRKADFGVVINGGYYAINGFYNLSWEQPIGLHRFTYNASSGHRQDTFKRDFDNTQCFFQFEQDKQTKPFEEYTPEKGIASTLHLKTQTPASVTEHYGCVRITVDGNVDIQKVSDFTDASFKDYIADAEYLMSSGPMLVQNGKELITKDLLETDPRFQFKHVFARFGAHPGSVPPGTFYHADQLNPRSAIGITKNGELLLVTVKGEEEPSKRDGMTLDQFALLMKLLGSETALNLDGGYSACQGIFDRSKMLTPSFVKKQGRDKLLPCAFVVTQKTATPNINYARSSMINVLPEDLEKTKRKLAFGNDI